MAVRFCSFAVVDYLPAFWSLTMRLLSLIVALLWLKLGVALGKANANSLDPQSTAKLIQIVNQVKTEKLSPSTLQAISVAFLGAKYQGGLLDRSLTEQLFVSLSEFDCVLFVETVLAIAQSVKQVQANNSSTIVNDFPSQIASLRYRHGVIDGYCSRLHYFTDWIQDNQKRGKVTDITQELGGIVDRNSLNFMTENRKSYRQLANDQSLYECIKAREQELAKTPRFYIPTSQITRIYSRLQAGDIIAIATTVKGLDVTHTGLVFIQGNHIGLIHASPDGAVKISPDLASYVSAVPDSKGIVVARPNL